MQDMFVALLLHIAANSVTYLSSHSIRLLCALLASNGLQLPPAPTTGVRRAHVSLQSMGMTSMMANGRFIVKSLEAVGLDYFWRIALEAESQAVADTAIELLNEFFCRCALPLPFPTPPLFSPLPAWRLPLGYLVLHDRCEVMGRL